MADIKKGALVSFTRSHDPQTVITGTVEEIFEGAEKKEEKKEGQAQ